MKDAISVGSRRFNTGSEQSTGASLYLQKRMADMGAEATVSRSPEEFRAFTVSERDRWGKVIREAKISTQ